MWSLDYEILSQSWGRSAVDAAVGIDDLGIEMSSGVRHWEPVREALSYCVVQRWEIRESVLEGYVM